MNIVLQDIVPPFAKKDEGFSKIIFPNNTSLYPHDIPKNDYEELALLGLGKNSTKHSSWKMLGSEVSGKFSPAKKLFFQHVTRSRNILCITSDAHSILHKSSYTLNENLEFIPLTSSMRSRIIRNIDALSSEGASVSGISIQKIESIPPDNRVTSPIIFIALGTRPFSVSQDANETLQKKYASHATIKIVSEESLPTCRWFAKKIGMHSSKDVCITSDDMQSMSDAELVPLMSSLHIFAGVRPLDRIRIARLLRQAGHELHN